jgi:RimJ/RimL family protein N-acetyltransferase
VAEPLELTIRAVTLDDLEPLIDLYLDTARHHVAIDPEGYRIPERADVAERLRRRVEAQDDRSTYVAALVEGRIVGSATMYVDDPPHPGSMSVPLRVGEFGVSVAEAWRGRGIGTALIRHLEAWAVARGAERIILNVSEANTDAIRLYHALGYVESGREMRKPANPAD